MDIQEQLISTIVDSIQDKKGSKIIVADLTEIEGVTVRNFIICNAKSTTQVAAVADNIREKVRVDLGIKPYGYDGYKNAQWIVIDYGHLYVHVFLPEVRDFYRLEQLWSDAKITEIPDLD